MFVHIDKKVFDRRPILGVLLGVGSLALWIILGTITYQEYKDFGKAPASVDLSTVIPPPENHGKWVEIRQPLIFHCDRGLQQVRQPPESWFYGKVDQTFFLADGVGFNRPVLTVYEGNVQCQDAANRPMVGVLEVLNSRRRSYLAGGGLEIPPKADMQFMVGDGPARYRKLMVECSFLPLLSLIMIRYYWPRWRAQVRHNEDPFGSISLGIPTPDVKH